MLSNLSREQLLEQANSQLIKIQQRNDALQKNIAIIDKAVMQVVSQQKAIMEEDIQQLKHVIEVLENKSRIASQKAQVKKVRENAYREIDRYTIIIRNFIKESFASQIESFISKGSLLNPIDGQKESFFNSMRAAGNADGVARSSSQDKSRAQDQDEHRFGNFNGSTGANHHYQQQQQQTPLPVIEETGQSQIRAGGGSELQSVTGINANYPESLASSVNQQMNHLNSVQGHSEVSQDGGAFLSLRDSVLPPERTSSYSNAPGNNNRPSLIANGAAPGQDQAAANGLAVVEEEQDIAPVQEVTVDDIVRLPRGQQQIALMGSALHLERERDQLLNDIDREQQKLKQIIQLTNNAVGDRYNDNGVIEETYTTHNADDNNNNNSNYSNASRRNGSYDQYSGEQAADKRNAFGVDNANYNNNNNSGGAGAYAQNNQPRTKDQNGAPAEGRNGAQNLGPQRYIVQLQSEGGTMGNSENDFANPAEGDANTKLLPDGQQGEQKQKCCRRRVIITTGVIILLIVIVLVVLYLTKMI